jgi:hypothetical protein
MNKIKTLILLGGLHLVEGGCVTDISEGLAGSFFGVGVSNMGMNSGYMGRWALRPRGGERK